MGMERPASGSTRVRRLRGRSCPRKSCNLHCLFKLSVLLLGRDVTLFSEVICNNLQMLRGCCGETGNQGGCLSAERGSLSGSFPAYHAELSSRPDPKRTILGVR